MMEIEVPAGVSAGATIAVLTPDGDSFEVEVPEGVAPGSTMLVELPPVQQGMEVQRVEVQVPEGIEAGDSFSVQLADGSMVDVELPNGMCAGETLHVDIPASAAVPQLQQPQLLESLPLLPTPPPSAPQQQQSEQSQPQPQPLEELPRLPPPPSSPPAAASPQSSSNSPSTPSNTTTRSGGTRFGERFSASRQKQHFNASGHLACAASPKLRHAGDRAAGAFGCRGDDDDGDDGQAPLKAPASGPELMRCRSDALRTPRPEEGCRYYVGQFVQLLRSSGEWSGGVVLELMHGIETMYRCRLGEGVLEKLVGEEEVREPRPDEGFRSCKGEIVQIDRPNGMLELATITATSTDTSRSRPERWYSCRVHPSATTPDAVVESIHEDDLLPPRPQAGCAFYVGQLVQAHRPDGSWTLARVLEFEMIGYSLGYKCAVEDALTRGATW
jgi:hypothetical protein